MNKRISSIFISYLIAITITASLAGCPPPLPSLVTVPDLSGMDQGTAEAALTSARLAAGTISSEHSDTVAVGNVISQDPEAGRMVAANTVVDMVVSLGPDPQLTGSHAGRYTTYEGSKTCNGCHPGKAEEVHGSIHYQWDSETGGKLTGINDFCTYPAINFIDILTNSEGEQVSGGCAQCHVGIGAKPTLEATQDQLENIDCLICHSESYKRKVAKMEDESLRFLPDEDAMSVSLVQAITDITRSSSATCLNCHAKAGGGPNNKRGDIEPEHYNASPEFDVHMAAAKSGGVGLGCIDCHTVEAHRIAGRGVDLRPTDLDMDLACTSCHVSTPHTDSRLNAHTARVNCTVCHIPAFARGASGTDMYRDFSGIEFNEGKKLYEPIIHREANVLPEYRFWDGTSFIPSYGDPVTVSDESGNVVMAAPNGGVSTPGAKIYAFKLHRALQPKRSDDDSLIGLKMGILFQHGALDFSAGMPTMALWNMEATDAEVVDASIRAGASAAGNPLPGSESAYAFVQTERWMGIFHEVAPTENALSCSDCHFGGTRLDFEVLGYDVKDDPSLCATCHDDYSGFWTQSVLFAEVHTEHVTENSLDCTACHSFPKAS